MTVNYITRHGFKYEAVYGTYTAPAVGDTFYLLGLYDDGQIATVNVEQEVNEVMDNVNAYAAELKVGKKSVRGSLNGILCNGIPAYLALGESVTTTNIHLLTPSFDQPSITMHNEERGGTESILRDALGCVPESLYLDCDVLNGNFLKYQLTILGIQERSSQNGSNPAVQLTNAPALPTASNSSPLSLNTAAVWDFGGTPINVTITRFETVWRNGLTPAETAFTSNWATHAGRKRMPGTGTLAINFICDKRWPHEAIIGALQEDMRFDFTDPTDAAAQYAYLKFVDVTPVSGLQILHEAGQHVLCRLECKYRKPEWSFLDGIIDEPTFYGE